MVFVGIGLATGPPERLLAEGFGLAFVKSFLMDICGAGLCDFKHFLEFDFTCPSVLVLAGLPSPLICVI